MTLVVSQVLDSVGLSDEGKKVVRKEVAAAARASAGFAEVMAMRRT